MAALQVAVQRVLFDVLQQCPARAVHDALRSPGGARGVHDVKRMVERQAFEGDLRRGTTGHEFIERNGLLGAAEVRRGGGVGHDDDALDRRNPLGNRREPADRVEPLPTVEVAVGAEQHLGRDLTEAVHHPLHAEVRGGG